MENKYFGTPPNVDGIKLDPKFPCDDMSGYYITQKELEMSRQIVSFIGYFGAMIRDVDLDKMVERFNNSVPIDDASTLEDGAGIASVGSHTDNPAEDIETVAKIAVLMQHIIKNVDRAAEELHEVSDGKFKDLTKERLEKLQARIRHFGRNITDPDRRVAIGPSPVDNPCGNPDCPDCGPNHKNEESDFMTRLMEASRRLGGKVKQERLSMAQQPEHPVGTTPNPAANPTKADIEAALKRMAKEFGLDK